MLQAASDSAASRAPASQSAAGFASGPGTLSRELSTAAVEGSDDEQEDSAAASSAAAAFIPDMSGTWVGGRAGGVMSAQLCRTSACPSPFPVQEADSARSESMDPMFALMGLGWMLRKIAGSIKAVSTYTHDKGAPGRAPSLRISAVTSMGTDVKDIALTGKPQELKGGDGKVR